MPWMNGRGPVDRAAKYLVRNAAFLHYDRVLADGLPVATGVIEGACRDLVQDCMGRTGVRWSLAGAEAILRIRAPAATSMTSGCSILQRITSARINPATPTTRPPVRCCPRDHTLVK